MTRRDDAASNEPAFNEPAFDSRRYAMLWRHGFAELHVVGNTADELCEIS